MAGAARVGDPHICPVTSPNPHIGGPVQPPASPDVETGGMAQARAGDKVTCSGSPAPDFIVTGSGTVIIGDKPAARMGDKTMHGGAVIFGDANVQIYGPTVGITLGGTSAGYNTCVNMAAGRSPPKKPEVYPPDDSRAGQTLPYSTSQQTYNNCGIESARQIINHARPNCTVDQETLLDEALINGWADKGPSRYRSGGAHPKDQAAILGHYGILAHTELATMENLQQAVAEGKGVIASVASGTLWGDNPGGGAHSVLVTGIEYDENGQLKNVIINDTCSQHIPAATFAQALQDYNFRPVSEQQQAAVQQSVGVLGEGLVVTNSPLWRE